MITFKSGDLLREDAEALVNTVNCVGVMGRGIALQFKKAYPDNFVQYEQACKRGEVLPGRMLVYEALSLTNPGYIINFPTKRHWKGASRVEDVAAGLDDLTRVIKERGIKSVALPPLGCGLGGLRWEDVRDLIVNKAQALEGVRVIVFEPCGAPAAESMPAAKAIPRMTAGRAALIKMIHDYLDWMLDPWVTLLEVHKLMYFLNEVGQPTKLKFVKAPHGPYAENMSHVLNAIEGYMVSGYGDGGDDPRKRIDLVPGAYEDAEAFLAGAEDTRDRTRRVLALIEGFEDGYGLELLSTLHWLKTYEGADSFERAVSGFYAWSPYKREFTEAQIRIGWDTLNERLMRV